MPPLGAGPVSAIGYDASGNTTQYTAAGSSTYLGWDSAGRNITARADGAGPAEVGYTRDATDRIVKRHATSGDTPTDVLYSYTGAGDTPDLTLALDKRLLTRTIALLGGVLYTASGAQPPTWDHPSVRGDLCLRTDNTGQQTGPLRTYTPYGDPLTTTGSVDPDTDPDTQPGAFDHGWLGQHQRPHEHAGALNLIQMGARPYTPLLGRFLTVDPVEGGSANDYDYTHANPINRSDVNGREPRRLPCTGYSCDSWVVPPSTPRCPCDWLTSHPIDVLLIASSFVGAGEAALSVRATQITVRLIVRKGKSYGISIVGKRRGVKVRYDRQPHDFGRAGRRSHLQVDTWKPSVKGSTRTLRIPIPFGRGVN